MRGIVAGIISALCIFGIFGLLSVSVDLDSIWKILGISAPIDFTDTAGRNFHTALLFILFACSFSIIATAFAFRSVSVRRCLGVSMAGDYRQLSTSVWEPISNNYSDGINNEWTDYKKVRKK